MHMFPYSKLNVCAVSAHMQITFLFFFILCNLVFFGLKEDQNPNHK